MRDARRVGSDRPVRPLLGLESRAVLMRQGSQAVVLQTASIGMFHGETEHLGETGAPAKLLWQYLGRSVVISLARLTKESKPLEHSELVEGYWRCSRPSRGPVGPGGASASPSRWGANVWPRWSAHDTPPRPDEASSP